MDSPDIQSESAINPASSPADDFYSGALGRISKCMIVLAVILSATAWVRLGWHIALGFVCGCALAYLNFHWLEKVVNVLGERMSAEEKPKSGKGVVVRFLLRYVLMGLAAYAIFTVSRASLNGLLAGLFLPVAGIFCEVAYEAYAALARGF